MGDRKAAGESAKISRKKNFFLNFENFTNPNLGCNFARTVAEFWIIYNGTIAARDTYKITNPIMSQEEQNNH